MKKKDEERKERKEELRVDSPGDAIVDLAVDEEAAVISAIGEGGGGEEEKEKGEKEEERAPHLPQYGEDSGQSKGQRGIAARREEERERRRMHLK